LISRYDEDGFAFAPMHADRLWCVLACRERRSKPENIRLGLDFHRLGHRFAKGIAPVFSSSWAAISKILLPTSESPRGQKVETYSSNSEFE